MHNHKFNYYQTEYIDCNKRNKSLEVHWHKSIPDNKINQCISNVKSLLEILPVKILLLDSTNLLSYDLALNWKIIESSWKVFYDNGGEKIVILNKKGLSSSLVDEYKCVIKKYGIPIELEFKEKIAN